MTEESRLRLTYARACRTMTYKLEGTQTRATFQPPPRVAKNHRGSHIRIWRESCAWTTNYTRQA